MRLDIIVVAHKGYSSRYPECTRLAFEKAIEAGCDFIEVDVMRTRDGRFVVFHAGDLEEVTSGHGTIGGTTFAELAGVNVVGSTGGEYGLQRIPPLEEILALARGAGVRVCAEMKDVERRDIHGYAGQVMPLFRDAGLLGRLVVNTSNPEFIAECRSEYPEVPIAMDLRGGGGGTDDLQGFIRRALAQGAQIVEFDYRHMSAERVHALRCSGLAVWAWTLNRREDMMAAIEMGADAILTDDPRLLDEFRRQP